MTQNTLPTAHSVRRTTEVVASLMIVLFLYTGLSKLLDVDTFRGQILLQPFPGWLEELVVWVLPPTELLVCGLLAFRPTRRAGLYAAAGLMAAFTGYVLLALAGAFGSVPCSCGGVLRQLSWEAHLVFNLFFLALPVGAIILEQKARQRGQSGVSPQPAAGQKGGQTTKES
ncbi:MauE/DoxX family redox-associated membrane protein [Pontibacter litorisediminis]|uniref:MauE/DoxX family redox-associated membrane protein n=1 Tax=Pontibacter litorisediminis TaxID=1846260 RepID=UPI0023EC4D4C|nr:MauE/DoxX family redox-associated membrane protein [Pontibacter litorisediminis]